MAAAGSDEPGAPAFSTVRLAAWVTTTTLPDRWPRALPAPEEVVAPELPAAVRIAAGDDDAVGEAADEVPLPTHDGVVVKLIGAVPEPCAEVVGWAVVAAPAQPLAAEFWSSRRASCSSSCSRCRPTWRIRATAAALRALVPIPARSVSRRREAGVSDPRHPRSRATSVRSLRFSAAVVDAALCFCRASLCFGVPAWSAVAPDGPAAADEADVESVPEAADPEAAEPEATLELAEPVTPDTAWPAVDVAPETTLPTPRVTLPTVEESRWVVEPPEEVPVGEGVVTDGVLTEGVETEGVVTDGAPPVEGVVTDGTVTEGTVTDGTVTLGAAAAEGVWTEGTVAAEPARG